MPGHSPAACTSSARLRLLGAFAVLADHGVTAHPGIDARPDAARRELRSAILAEHPDAIGSYVFWTAADEGAFAADGTLLGPLVLHHSGEETRRAVHAALGRQGLRAREGAEPGTLRLDPADNPAWGRASACRYSASC